MSTHPDPGAMLPPVDERLVMPESGYEVVDGEVIKVAPADPPLASQQSKLSAILEAHVIEGYDAVADMLTRTSALGDMAPDASVYATAPDPQTGGRQLEDLAFEVVSTQTLSDAATKAARLTQRGVRRVLAIDVKRQRVLEWSEALGTWELLAPDAVIEDRVFVIGIPVADLASAARTDNAVARALLAKHNPVLDSALANSHSEGVAQGVTDGIAQGLAESVIATLHARQIPHSAEDRTTLLAVRDVDLLRRLVVLAATCDQLDELLRLVRSS